MNVQGGGRHVSEDDPRSSYDQVALSADITLDRPVDFDVSTRDRTLSVAARIDAEIAV